MLDMGKGGAHPASQDRATQASPQAPTGLGHPVSVPLRGESRCDDCGGGNPVWFAPNALWNLVIGGPQARGDPGGFVCPGCFITRAEAAGVHPTAWELRPEKFADWRPIETAPVDGSPVLAHWPHLERPVIAWISQGGASIGHWTFATYKYETANPVSSPTHWSPLPELPKVERAGA